MSLIIDDVREDNGRRLWLGVAFAIIFALAVAAFFIGRAQAMDAHTNSPSATTTSDDSEVGNHAAQ